MGKVIGGGMPVGAFGGKREIMEKISPLGPVYQAGTLSGNPIAMTAGLKTLELISETDFYSKLTAKTEALLSGLKIRAAAAGVSVTTNQAGGMFGLFFSDAEKVSDFTQSMACNQERFRKFFHAMLDRGVYLAPSAFEAGFVSAAHSDEDLQQTLNAAEESFAEVA